MITIPDPKTRTWAQPNDGDFNGNVYVSRGVSTDYPGLLTLSRRARNIGDSDVDADMKLPIAAAYNSTPGKYVIVTSGGTTGKIFTLTYDLRTFAEDVSANVPTDLRYGVSDIVTFNGKLYCSESTTTNSLSNTTWTADVIAHAGPLAVFDNLQYLAIGESNKVYLYDTSDALVYTCTIPAKYAITTICYSANKLFIGTRDTTGGDAKLFIWLGTATEGAQYGFSIGTYRINSVVPYKQSVALVDSLGRLMYFNGSGFDMLAAFPAYYTHDQWDNEGTLNYGKVVHRGMWVEGDLIFINVQSSLNPNDGQPGSRAYLPEFPGGIWCYDPAVGLHHRYGIGAAYRLETGAVTTANVNTTTDVVTTTGVPDTGTPVLYDDGAAGAGTAIGGLVHRQKYYVIKTASTTMKLASTYALAIAGTQIDLTGTGNNAQFFVYLPNAEFGATVVGGVAGSSNGGVIWPLNGVNDTPLVSNGTRCLFGQINPKNAVGTAKYVVCTPAANQENRGAWISPKLRSSAVDDLFAQLAVKYRKVETAEDKILVKARSKEIVGLPCPPISSNSSGGTWTSQTVFTTTEDISVAKTQFDAGVDIEVEILRGAGAGYLAHVTALTYSAPTYTVTIDETVQNVAAADTMWFQMTNWTKFGEITSADSDFVKTIGLGLKGQWVQLKLELRGENVAVEEVQVDTAKNRQLS